MGCTSSSSACSSSRYPRASMEEDNNDMGDMHDLYPSFGNANPKIRTSKHIRGPPRNLKHAN